MRSTPFGLAVPLLLVFAAFAAATIIPGAAAQSPTYTINGRVLSDAGVPIEGAQVNAWTYQEDPALSSTKGSDETVTDAEGRYTLTLAGGRGSLSVYYEKWRQSDARDIVLDADQTIDFTLKAPPPRTAVIQGVVVDANGAPVAGAEVQPSSICCYAYAEAIPTQPPTTEPASPPAEPMPPAEGGASGSDAPGSGENASSDASTGSKVAPDMMPRPIMPPYYDDWATTTTGDDGAFRFEVYAGERQVTAWAKGYAQTTEQVEAKDGETTELRLVLEKVPGRDAVLEGRVVDRQTGLPIAGATVNLRSLEWGRYAHAEADEGGNFRIQTVPGWTEVSVSFYRYAEPMPLTDLAMPVAATQQYYAFSELVALEAGSNPYEAKLQPKPKPDVVLVGYVVDPDAETGVEGARVSVWNQDTGDWGEALTDKTGSYRILVREGHHTVNAWKEGYLGGTQTFVVDDASERVDVILPKGTMRYAPCYDESDCGYPVLYGMKGEERAIAIADGDAAPPPAAPAPALAGATATGSASFRSGADTSRSASYEGSGGGLPPYDPDAHAATTGDDASAQREAIPATGLLAALAVVGLAAFLLRRK